jgi:hypothetical protein
VNNKNIVMSRNQKRVARREKPTASISRVDFSSLKSINSIQMMDRRISRIIDNEKSIVLMLLDEKEAIGNVRFRREKFCLLNKKNWLVLENKPKIRTNCATQLLKSLLLKPSND